MSLDEVSVQQLQLLLFEEAAAHIISFREQRAAPSPSEGSSQLASYWYTTTTRKSRLSR